MKTRHELVMDLKKSDALADGELTVRKHNRLARTHGFAHANTYINRFGSWKIAKVEANILDL